MNLTDNYKVAIVGRPNVGKSSIFNILVGKRIAIVDSAAGITRDRIFSKVVHNNKSFDLIDTGGFFEGCENILDEALLAQLDEAINEADLILFVLDVQAGVHPMDSQIFLRLKKTGKSILIALNKADNSKLENAGYEFMKLGIEKYVSVSALHRTRMETLLKEILQFVPENEEDNNKEPFKITVVGKPNVGKSSLINMILQCNRSLVHHEPGTTRDAIQIDFYHNNELYAFVDTAGLTRRSRVKAPVDVFSIMRAKTAIQHSDLVIVMMDAERNIESQDVRIAKMVADMGKCSFLIVNKWDLAKGVRQEHYKKYIREKVPFLSYVPVLFTSVKQEKNLSKVMDFVHELKIRAFKKIPTSLLNQAIKKAMQKTLPPTIRGKRLKIYYATQIKEMPPTFNFFVNSTESASTTYLKYIENQLRESFELQGMPLFFKLKPKKKDSKTIDV